MAALAVQETQSEASALAPDLQEPLLELALELEESATWKASEAWESEASSEPADSGSESRQSGLVVEAGGKAAAPEEQVPTEEVEGW